MDKVYTIDEIRNIVVPIAAAHDVGRVYLFGSYARGDATSNSDIDLLGRSNSLETEGLSPIGTQCDLWGIMPVRGYRL